MHRIICSCLLGLSFIFVGHSSYAQNFGINTNNPQTALDVKGEITTDSGFTIRPASALAGDNIPINFQTSLIRIEEDGQSKANNITINGTPQQGHLLMIINGDANDVKLGSTTIKNNEAAQFVYLGSNWRAVPTVSGGGSLANFTENSYTGLGGGSVLQPNGSSNESIVLLPVGSGAILADRPDGATSGGDIRGNYALDFQKGQSNL